MGEPEYLSVLDALDGLVRDPRPVDQQLELLGIKGIRHHPEACPVSEYLGDYVLGLWSSSVEISRTLAIYETDFESVEIPTPHKISEFITRFDRGEFPNLEKKQ